MDKVSITVSSNRTVRIDSSVEGFIRKEKGKDLSVHFKRNQRKENTEIAHEQQDIRVVYA